MENEASKFSPEKERIPNGIAFVFSHWVEKGNPTELNEESKERLNKSVELYNEGKLAYILVAGGEFVEGLEKPVAKMMSDYLITKGIPKDIIIEERHSKDTTSNVRFGNFLLKLNKIDDLPIYYISSGYHLKRIEEIVNGQNKNKKDDQFISSGREELKGMAKIIESINGFINRYDPEGKSLLAKTMRKKRSHPIKQIKK